jgi:hypothetical protein
MLTRDDLAVMAAIALALADNPDAPIHRLTGPSDKLRRGRSSVNETARQRK